MYQVPLRLLSKMVMEIEHCACICPCAYLTHVNIFVPILVLMLALYNIHVNQPQRYLEAQESDL